MIAMEYFFNKEEIQEMLQTEMLGLGATGKWGSWGFPTISPVDLTKQVCFLYDADTLNFLSVNKPGLAFYGLKSEKELASKDVFFLEKLKQNAYPNLNISFAHRLMSDMKNTLSKGNAQICFPLNMIDEKGFCVIEPTIIVPSFVDKKIKALLSISLLNTQYTLPDDLYDRYKSVYKNDMERGNQLFLEYLGLPIHGAMLTTNEIDRLIALTKYRTKEEASSELNLSVDELTSFSQEIKDRLQNQNLNDILSYFTLSNRRKF
jgi:hypothetical protein